MACAKTKKGQAQLQEEHPEWCRAEPFPVLGTCVTTGPRQNTAKETGRLQMAVKRTQLIKALPVPYAAKLTLFRKLALPVASFGWGSRVPPKQVSNSLFSSTLTATLGRNRMASPLIRSVIYGGTVHLRPVLLQRLFARLCRLRKTSPACRWGKQPGTQVATLRKILKDDAWQEEGPWCWYHPISDLHLEIPAAADKDDIASGTHQLREAWRGATLTKWAKGGRHEAQAWEASDADICRAAKHIDFAWLRTFLDRCSGAARSVMLGSVVSPAWMSRIPNANHDGRCDYCPEVFATWFHLAWNCDGFPDVLTMRPSSPTHYLAMRMGWPFKNQPEDERLQIMEWLSHVAQHIWLGRHGNG